MRSAELGICFGADGFSTLESLVQCGSEISATSLALRAWDRGECLGDLLGDRSRDFMSRFIGDIFGLLLRERPDAEADAVTECSLATDVLSVLSIDSPGELCALACLLRSLDDRRSTLGDMRLRKLVILVLRDLRNGEGSRSFTDESVPLRLSLCLILGEFGALSESFFRVRLGVLFVDDSPLAARISLRIFSASWESSGSPWLPIRSR